LNNSSLKEDVHHRQEMDFGQAHPLAWEKMDMPR